MKLFFTRISSFFTAIGVWLGTIFFPASTVGVFADKVETPAKIVFDEGEFIMGKSDIVVAPNGKDSNPGTAELPLRTPEAAKELAKSKSGEVTVWFREGTYYLSKPLNFNSADKSGVTYRSYPYEKVVFSGAKEISGFTETTINGVDAFVADVEISCENDYFRALYKGDQRLSRSNYPKEGVFNVARADEADKLVPSVELFGAHAAFFVSPENAMDFANVTDVDVRIMHYWCDDVLPLVSINAETGRVETSKPSAMDISEGENYVFENVREALSLPEEWYLDRAEQKLYYIPAAGETAENTVLYAGNLKKLVEINGVSDITFSGIEFEKTNWEHVSGNLHWEKADTSNPLYKNIKYITNHPQAAYDIPAAINVSDASQINFINCDFRNISFSAVMFGSDVTESSVRSSHFEQIGANAVYIKGDRVYPASTNNITVNDCLIEYYGRISNNAIGIMLIDAADCEFSNNEIHDGWYTGISIGWVWGYTENPTNGIKVLNNHIYNIGNGWLSDMGGIYTLGIQPDTVLSGNVIHDVGCYGGESGYGGWGIYLDEGSTEILVENNLVYDCSSQLFHQHYGRDNVIRNNIFAFGGDGQFRITRNEEHNSLFLENNILVGNGNTMYWNTTDVDWFKDNGNLYYDYKTGGNVYSGNTDSFGAKENLVIMTAKGYYNNAVFENPLFKDAENRDFTLAENSPAIANGFVPFSYNAGTITQF